MKPILYMLTAITLFLFLLAYRYEVTQMEKWRALPAMEKRLVQCGEQWRHVYEDARWRSEQIGGMVEWESDCSVSVERY